jgi:hypothetical protein
MVINPTPIAVSRKVGEETIRTQEWALIAPGQNLRLAKTFNADAGASIITTTANELVGMLWGKRDDGFLVFTPIIDIFLAIKRTCGAKNICLAPEAIGKPPSPTPIATGNSVAVTYIARDINEESETEIIPKPSDLQFRSLPIQAKPIASDSNEDSPGRVNFPLLEKLIVSNSSTRRDRVASPVPSLTCTTSSCTGSAPVTPVDSNTFIWSLGPQAGPKHSAAVADNPDKEPPRRDQEVSPCRRNPRPDPCKENKHSIHFLLDSNDDCPPKRMALQ